MSFSFDSLATLDENAVRDLSERGSKYYREHLQAILEPEQNGKAIAFNPYTGVYFVADSTTLASRAMRAQHPGGGFVVMTIGPEPNHALAARFLAGKRTLSDKSR